jgi:ABC-type branched-subunit amino acid transport system substrate-binding protein
MMANHMLLLLLLLLLLLRPAARASSAARFCGENTSHAWATRCAGSKGSGHVHIAALLDNANDPGKEIHFRLAVDLINNHTDGWHDELLNGTLLNVMVASSNCDSVQAAHSFWKVWQDWGRPLHGIVGARCSGASMAVAAIAGLDEVPQISMGSTSASLSNAHKYPYFFRTVAPDNEHGLVGAIVQMMVAFKWRHISLIQTDVMYANTLATEFTKAWCTAPDRSIGYSHVIRGASASSSSALPMQAIHQALGGVPSDDPTINSRVIVLAAHQHHALSILEQAQDERYKGAFSDTIFVHSLPPNDYTPTGVGVHKPAWMPSVPGYLGVVPFSSSSAAHAAYLAKLHILEESLGRQRSVHLPAYVAETVDAVISFAKALNPLDHEARANGSAVREQLRQLSFSGVSGEVAFTDAGDRKDPLYSVVNLGAGDTWELIGSVGTKTNTADLRVSKVCWAGVGCGLAEAPLDRYPLPPVLHGLSQSVVIIIIIATLAMIGATVKIVWDARSRVLLANSHYTSFLSHSKGEGGAEAQTLNTALDKALLKGSCFLATNRGKNFIDTRELNHITTMELVQAIKRSKVFVLLLTKSVLTRPWCLLEVYTALDAGIPIVPVKVFRQDPDAEYDFANNASFLSNLENNVYNESYMQTTFGVPAWQSDQWDPIEATFTASRAEIDQMAEYVAKASGDRLHPDAIKLSRTISTQDGEKLTLRNVQKLLSAELPSYKSEEFKPNAHPKVIEVQTQVIVDRIESLLGVGRKKSTSRQAMDSAMLKIGALRTIGRSSESFRTQLGPPTMRALTPGGNSTTNDEETTLKGLAEVNHLREQSRPEPELEPTPMSWQAGRLGV